MDYLCGDVCCPKCTKSGSFQHVVDLDNMGITIMKYVADIFQKEPILGDFSSVRNIYDHYKNNIFIIINTNREDSNIKEISSDDIQPKFDINKVSCPRCRYRAEKAINLLKSKTNLRIDDIRGICDHCKAQLSQKPCAICEETVKKFLEETKLNAKQKTEKSIWYKQRVPHSHRPLSSDRRIRKINLDIDTPKSGIDTLLDLKLALRTKTDLYKPLLVPPKHQLALKKSLVETSSRDMPKIDDFPSDESVITSFITTFSKTLKDQKERSFKYVFPEEKVETHESKAVEITSSELIKMTHDRARQKIETQREIGGGKYYDQKTKEKDEKDEKYQEIKAISSKMEPMLQKSRKGEVRPRSSEIKPTRSVIESKKSEIRPRSSETKTTKSDHKAKESKGKKDETKVKLQTVDAQVSKVSKVASATKPQPSQDQVKKSIQQDAKQGSQYVETKKVEKREGEKREGEKREGEKRERENRERENRERENRERENRERENREREKREGEKKPTPQDIKTKTGKEKPADRVEKKTQLQDFTTKQGEEKTVSRKDTEKQKVDKSQLKEAKKTVKPPPPPPASLDTKQKTKDLDKDKVEKQTEKQQDSSKKDEKKGKIKDKEDKKKEPIKETPELKEDIKKVTRMGGTKIPPSMMLPQPTTKEIKDSKSTEIKTLPPKKGVIPPEVSVKNKATQAKEAEDRRKERKLQAASPKSGDEKQKQTQDETKEEEQEVKKDVGKKSTVKEKENEKEKKKEKDDKVIKEDEKGKAEPPKKDVFDILKFLPPKKVVVTTKVADPLAAIKLAEQRMKELEAAGLAAARKETEKIGVLTELPRGEHFLFKIKANVVPHMDETRRKKLKDLLLSSVQLKSMKMRGPSFDDLILKMVKLGKKAIKSSKKSNKIMRTKKQGKYKIRSAKRTVSLWSLSIDSEVELEIDCLAHIVKIQQIRHKIKGPEIVKNVCDKPKLKLQPDPIVFYKNHEHDPLVEVHDVEETQKVSELVPKGIMRYSLSDPAFIEKGWTVLPTMKVVRKMNVYKMKPSYPEFDWFCYNKKRRYLTYDTGEKLADFDDNGRGRWYYKNGRIALDYYDSEDIHAQQRFVLYSSGEEEEHCRSLTTVLGLFDYLGNGVVFDHAGKIRVKYNQSEGVLLDSGIGPTSRWKWHSLNDPPVLKQVMINTFMENLDPHILKFEDDNENPHIIDEEMLAIEIDNVIKEKTKMQKQKFLPFQIKMKALKINKQLSLRILDQAHVYLYFRDGTANMKLNLGMVLDNNEIIDTDTTDVGDVSNVLEKFPPNTESIVNLQDKLEKIRRCDRERTNNLMRVRTILPVSSADKMIQAKSKPLRHPLSVACASDDDPCTHRKPSKINLYYNTRLI